MNTSAGRYLKRAVSTSVGHPALAEFEAYAEREDNAHNRQNSLTSASLCAPAIVGESLASQVSRYHIASGHPTTGQTYEELFQRRPFALTSWIPYYLSPLLVRLKGEPHEVMRRLLCQSTLFPLFEMFNGARFEVTSLHAVDAALRQLPKRIVAESGWTRVCPQCLTDDLRDFGTPTIRLAHQIPGVSVCDRHGALLFDRCPACRCPFERPNDLVLAPWTGCSACRVRLNEFHACGETEWQDSKLHRFAQFARRLLEADFTPISRYALRDMYRRRLIELGISKKNQVDRIVLERELLSFWGGDQIARIDPARRLGRTSGWFHILVGSVCWEVPLGRHLLLSHFLFETDEDFLAHYSAAGSRPAAVAGRSPHMNRGSSISDRSGCQVIMATLLDASRQIPGCDVDALWQRHYGLMKRLVRRDPQALSRLEKVIASRDLCERIRPGKKRSAHAEDDALAESLRRSSVEFFESPQRPQKGTRNRLLMSIGWRRGALADPIAFPALSSALEEFAESAWHFYLRRLLWAFSQRSGGALNFCEIKGLSGIEYHRLTVLLEDVRRRGVPDGLTSSGIMDTIRLWRIGFQWEGPCPDRIFPPAGRRHQQLRSSG
ncbi:TnsD domain-containing protein [Paraburkholderia tropica]|nr:TnsD domain-containing protein [Paraburkholderia tropica]